ncbi:hypothetical protein RAZWK3B_00665 [Roseobacter sp. AzwK-3b]|nr:hypothetical protein RAZWK3B_00665 [Roseobacter sp. AzwK-3b]
METRGIFHFVTPIGPSLSAKGKGSPNVITRLCQMLEKHGVRSETLTSDELIARGPAPHERAHALLHFNELNYVSAGEPPELAAIESELETLGYTLHHRGAAARVVGDKRRQNAVLTAAGVPMPRLLQGQAGDETVFSNEAVNAHVKVDVLPPGSALDDARYNTTLVDTVHEVQGRAFHVSLRAICFGARVLYAWPRCRDVAEGDPSVHTGDTPADLAVISDLHARLVVPNKRQIARIARGVSEALGCNFYAHDLLPCAATGKLLLCETNLKFYDGRYRWQMMPIKDEHPVAAMFNGKTYARRAARIIIAETGL